MISSDVLIPYALHLPTGRILHVTEAENGLECACICTSCKTRVVARQGDVNVWHFAHFTNQDVCVSAQETALHLAAKQLFAEHGKIRLPALYGRYPNGQYANEPSQHADTVPLTDISLEYRGLAGIVPDVYALAPDGPLIVEIHVSHAVDDVKAERIAGHGIAAIEISLSRATDIWSDPEEFRKEVLLWATRSWLFHPRQAALDEALAAQLRASEAAWQAAREAAHAQRRAAEAERLAVLSEAERQMEDRRRAIAAARRAYELQEQEHRSTLVERMLAWADGYYPKREQSPPADLERIRRDEVRALFRDCPSRMAHYALVDQAPIRAWFDAVVKAEVKEAWQRYEPREAPLSQPPPVPLPLFDQHELAVEAPTVVDFAGVGGDEVGDAVEARAER